MKDEQKIAKNYKKSAFFVCAIGFCVFKHTKKFVYDKKTPYLCSTLKEFRITITQYLK